MLSYILYNRKKRSHASSTPRILTCSLARSEPLAAAAVMGGADKDDKDQDVWRPDGMGRHGLEEDYEYVMYQKV